jgi:Rieske Fe-S protein
MSETTRRGVLAGAAGVGAAAVLAACGSSNDSSSSGSGTDANTPAAAPTTAGQQQGGQTGGGTAIKASDIPVGGGKIFKEQNVVVTQPTAGEFKAFSATCTHMGCPVSAIANGTINCNCHQSKFAVTDGSVKGGPATKALAAKTVTVSGDSITVA